MKRAFSDHRDDIAFAVLVFAFALALRLGYSVLTSGAYDFDEFVYLLLGHAVATGQMPYRDFLFFNPPGILEAVAALNPLISHWWIWARVASMVVDSGTCTVIYLITRRWCSPSVSLAAGFLCASSPIMLMTGTRVLPDVYIAFFGALSIYVLSLHRDWRFTLLAGVAMGIAVVFKYPAVLLVPACLLIAGKRTPIFLVGMAAAVVAAVLPFVASWHSFYADTVQFQQGRSAQLATIRFGSVILFAVLLQPLAVFGLFSRPRRWWLVAAYLAAFLYTFTHQVYYHYFAPMAPFGSILGAIYLARFRRLTPRTLVGGTAALAVAVALLWTAIVSNGGSFPLHTTDVPLSAVQAKTQFVEHNVASRALVLEDRPEASVLARRRNLKDYFWNDATVLTAQALQQGILHLRYIILTFGPSTGYPPGFTSWIDARFCRTLIGSEGFVYDTRCSNKSYLPPRG